MTRKLILACMAILIWGLAPSDAKAAITLGFDLDASTTDIDDERIVSPGQIFEIAVYIDLTATGAPTTIFGDFAFDVTYDTDHINVIELGSSVTPVGTPLPLRPVGLEQISTLVFGSGSVGPFDGNTGLAVVNAPAFFTVGTLQLEAINTTGISTEVLGRTLLGFDNLSGAVSDANLGAGSGLTSSTLVVTAVPEPSSVGLCVALGLLTRITRRRRVIF